MVYKILVALKSSRKIDNPDRPVSDAYTLSLPMGFGLAELMKNQDAWVSEALEKMRQECKGIDVEVVPHMKDQKLVITVLVRNHLADLRERMVHAMVDEIIQADSVGITAMCMSPAAPYATFVLTHMNTENFEDLRTVLSRDPRLPPNVRDTLCSWGDHLYWEPRLPYNADEADRIYSVPGDVKFHLQSVDSEPGYATPMRIRQERALLLPIAHPGLQPQDEHELKSMIQKADAEKELYLAWGADGAKTRTLVDKLKAAGLDRCVLYRDALGSEAAYGGGPARAFARRAQERMDGAVSYVIKEEGVYFKTFNWTPWSVP